MLLLLLLLLLLLIDETGILLLSENMMNPSKVHSWQLQAVPDVCPADDAAVVVVLILSFMYNSESRRARCKDAIALSYAPTSMHNAALLFSF